MYTHIIDIHKDICDINTVYEYDTHAINTHKNICDINTIYEYDTHTMERGAIGNKRPTGHNAHMNQLGSTVVLLL